jgi:hypothetical protein
MKDNISFIRKRVFTRCSQFRTALLATPTPKKKIIRMIRQMGSDIFKKNGYLPVVHQTTSFRKLKMNTDTPVYIAL